MDTTASFPVDKSGRKVNLTTYLHLMSISETNAAVPMFHHVISRHTCAQEQMYPQILGQGTENDRFPKSVQANPKQNLHHPLPPPPSPPLCECQVKVNFRYRMNPQPAKESPLILVQNCQLRNQRGTIFLYFFCAFARICEKRLLSS